MKFGLACLTIHPWQLNEMTLAAAEAIGADSLWTVDHMLGLGHPDLVAERPRTGTTSGPDAFFDPYLACAVLGSRSEIPMGIGVTDTTRRSAVDVARAAISLQHLCRGGFNLGLGAGVAMNLTPFGYPFDRPIAVTDEFLRTLRPLLDTGRMPGQRGVMGLPLVSAAGRPRVWLAAMGPRMLRLAGWIGHDPPRSLSP